ncbi:hypothetical protein SAMN05444340_115109 [Citreimonas salinaria]|uniref:EF-hand domain-containing protein n=2 Tax=Citreimonas salinaria TaxID=321339 RepID=A0A1H3M473_9RHOB|nr:hypothetical protein SAMN05444340_115109 [Citreimonas salinaria]
MKGTSGKHHNMATAYATFAAVALVTTSLSAQGFGDLDTDADGLLGSAEFGAGIGASGIFDRWDVDSDEALARREITEGIYDLWDSNDDGRLTVGEWDDAIDTWLGEDTVDLQVEEWDADSDGTLSAFEFLEAMEQTNLLARIGLDVSEGPLTEEAFSAGLFSLGDLDDDTFLGEDEDVWFVDLLEMFNAPDDVEVTQTSAMDPVDGDTADSEMPDLLPDGEAFSDLPIPCGEGDASCEAMAERFCAALDYDPPLGFLAAGGSLYVVRCADGF